MKKLTQKEVWNQIARPWKEYREKEIPEIREFLKGKKGKLLDLGCGSGRNFVKQAGLKIYGVDFSSEMLKLAEASARERKINVRLEEASAEKLPFVDGFFDFSIYIAALHCLESEKSRKKSLEELYRVLKKKGQAMIRVWSRNQERVKNLEKDSYVPWTRDGKKFMRYYYIYDKDELENLLKKIGFKILKSWEDKNIYVIVEK